MPFPPAFTNVWDTTQPPDTQAANLLGQDIRNLKTDIMQRLSLLSGTFANRPTPEIVNATWGGASYGLLYFSTDTNKVYQWSGAAWVDITSSFVNIPVVSGGTSGAVNVVAAVNTAGLNASVGTTLLYAVPAGSPGMYRISGEALITTAGAVGSLTPTVSYNNGVNAQGPYSWNATATAIIGSEGNPVSGQNSTFYSAGSQNINYACTLANGAGVIYTLRLRLEYLG